VLVRCITGDFVRPDEAMTKKLGLLKVVHIHGTEVQISFSMLKLINVSVHI